MDDGSIGWFIVIITACLVFGALFAAAEYAILPLRRTRVHELVDLEVRGARTVDKLLKDPDRLIITIQLGITLVQILAATYAATEVAHAIYVSGHPAHGVAASHWQWLAGRSEISIATVVAIVLALITVIFAELVPKRVALAHPERLALKGARYLEMFSVITYPLVWVLSQASYYPAKLLGAKPGPVQVMMSEEEVRLVVEEGHEQGTIEMGEREMIHSIFEFTDTMAKEVMTPRTDLDAVPIGIELPDLVRVAQETGHSRLLVYEESMDDVIGFVHVKDLLAPLMQPAHAFDIRSILRKPYYVPETKMVDQLLNEFRRDKIQLAIVVDEYGGTSGIVTVEDLLEEIVGEIQDEYDQEEEVLYRPIDEHSAIVDARLPVDDLIEIMDLDMEPEEDYETVGGLAAHLFDKVPEVGEVTKTDGIKITVTKADETHIEELKIERIPPEEAAVEG